jgi:hypothetical protein
VDAHGVLRRAERGGDLFGRPPGEKLGRDARLGRSQVEIAAQRLGRDQERRVGVGDERERRRAPATDLARAAGSCCRLSGSA